MRRMKVVVLVLVTSLQACGGKDSGTSAGQEAGGGAGTATVEQACLDYCTAMVEDAACATVPTLSECQTSCTSGAGVFPACLSELATAYGCYATVDNAWSCAEGTGVATSNDAVCTAEVTAVKSCLLAQGTEVEGTDAYCAKLSASTCSETPTAADCAVEISLMGTVYSNCLDELSAVLVCQADGSFSCNDSGEPVSTALSACTAQTQALLTCASKQ